MQPGWGLGLGWAEVHWQRPATAATALRPLHRFGDLLETAEAVESRLRRVDRFLEDGRGNSGTSTGPRVAVMAPPGPPPPPPSLPPTHTHTHAHTRTPITRTAITPAGRMLSHALAPVSRTICAHDTRARAAQLIAGDLTPVCATGGQQHTSLKCVSQTLSNH